MSSFVITIVLCSLAVFGLVNAIPMRQQQQQQQKDNNHPAAESGFSTVFWSVMDDCFGEDSDQPAAVCLKYKALTAMDRVLSKPTVTVVDGVALFARSGKALPVDVQAEKNDRAALDAAKDPDQKNALLDDMLFNRMEQIVSTRTIVMDGPNGEEGRGKKNKNKGMQQAMMMAGMTAVAVMGPMALKVIALIAVKALLISKIALLLSAITVLKKLMQSQKNSGSSHHETEVVSEHHHGRSMRLDAHDAAYSGQKQ